jgi:hypothetical protein
VALANATSGAQPSALAAGLVGAVLDAEPTDPQPWLPGPPVDPFAEPLLGRWWSEGSEFVFWWEGGALRSKAAAAPAGRPPTIFERDGDGWRATAGRERGERLRVDGERLIWAGYPFTRAQEPFAGQKSSSGLRRPRTR